MFAAISLAAGYHMMFDTGHITFLRFIPVVLPVFGNVLNRELLISPRPDFLVSRSFSGLAGCKDDLKSSSSRHARG